MTVYAEAISDFRNFQFPRARAGIGARRQFLLQVTSEQLTLNQRVQGSSPCAPTN